MRADDTRAPSGQTRPISELLDIANRAWDAYMRGDLDELLECLDPQAEWDLSNFGGWPEAQTYRGKAAVARFLADWTGFWESYEAGLDEMVEIAPDRVFAASWQRGYVAGSKLPIEQARLGSIATVRDGYIVRFEVWSDQDAAREAAFRR